MHENKGSLRSYLQQLQAVGACEFQMTQNPHARGVVEVTEQYWPYDRGWEEATQQDEAAAYGAEVKKHFLSQACVRSSFSVADERLAGHWFQQGVAAQRIENAILLGCTRKYVAWRNGQNRNPIASPRYFLSILEELSAQEIPSEYWEVSPVQAEPSGEAVAKQHTGRPRSLESRSTAWSNF